MSIDIVLPKLYLLDENTWFDIDLIFTYFNFKNIIFYISSDNNYIIYRCDTDNNIFDETLIYSFDYLEELYNSLRKKNK